MYSVDKRVLFRYIGNTLLLVGYYFLLFVDQKVGLVLRIIAPLLFLSSCIYLKLWDILILTGIFLAMDIAKLVYLLQH
jgi:hypothetical protein